MGGPFSMVKDNNGQTVWSDGPQNKYDPVLLRNFYKNNEILIKKVYFVTVYGCILVKEMLMRAVELLFATCCYLGIKKKDAK